jgi:hypothetical protein
MLNPPEDLTYGQIPPQVQAYLRMPGVNQEKAMQWFNLGLAEPQTFNQAVLLAQAVGYTPEQSKVVAAQWQKESGGGSHVGAAYNYFGIKSHNQAVRDALTARGINVGAGAETETKEVEGGKTKSQQSSFMQFNNAFEAFAGHKAFLETNQRYQGALSAETAKDFAIGLQKAGYATDPNYGTSLYNDYVAPKERNPESGDKRPKSLGIPSSSKDGAAPTMTVAVDTAPMKLPIIAPQNIMPRPEFSTDPTIEQSQYGETEFQQEVQPTAPIPMSAPAGYFGGDKTSFKMGGHMYPEGGNLTSAQLLQQAAGKGDPIEKADRKLSLAQVRRNRTLTNPDAWRFEYSPLSYNYSDFINSIGHEARAFTPNLFPSVSGSKSKKIDMKFPVSARVFQDYTDNAYAYNRNPDRFENVGEYINLGTDAATGFSNYVPYTRGIRDKNLGVEGKIGMHGLIGNSNIGPSGSAFGDFYGGYNTREGINFGVDPGAKFSYGWEPEASWMPDGRINTEFRVSTPYHVREKTPYYMLREYAPNIPVEDLNAPGGFNNPDIYKTRDTSAGNVTWGPKLAGQIQYTQKQGPLMGTTVGLRGDILFDMLNGKYTYNRIKNAYNNVAGGGTNPGMGNIVNTEKVDVTGFKQVPYINSQFYVNYPIAGAAAHMNVAKAKVAAQKARDEELFKNADAIIPPMPSTPMTDTRDQGVDFNPQEKPQTTGTPEGYLPGFNPTTGTQVGENFTQELYNQGPVMKQYGGQLGTNMTNMYKKGGMPYAMGGNMYSTGGKFDNSGFNALPMNVQNKIKANSFADGGPLTEFNAGGTHEQNPLGGIPQGTAPDGRPNLVEQGETKLDAANYIFSDNIKVNKETAEQFNLSKTDIGRTFADVSKKLNRPNSRRETDSIENVAKERELEALMAAQETQKEAELQKDIQMMTAKHPQFMEAMMQQQSVQPMGMPQAPPPEAMAEQMPPEGMQMDPNQIPPEMLAQMEGAQQGMPVMRMGGGMYKCGGKMYNFGGYMYANGGRMYDPGGPLLGGATTGSGYMSGFTQGYNPNLNAELINPWASNNQTIMNNMMNPSSTSPLYNLESPLSTPLGNTDATVVPENNALNNMSKGVGIATSLGQGAMNAINISQQQGLSNREKGEQYAQTALDAGIGVANTFLPGISTVYGIQKGLGNFADKIGEKGNETITSADGSVSAVRSGREGAQVLGDVASGILNPTQAFAQGVGYLADKNFKQAALMMVPGGSAINKSIDRKEENKRAEQIEKMNRGPQFSTLGMPVDDMPVTEDQMPLQYKYGGAMNAHSYRRAGQMDVKDKYDNKSKVTTNGDPNNYLNTALDDTKADIRSIAPFGSFAADLAPMAFNLYQGLSPYDEVRPEDLYSPLEAVRPDYTQAENQARQSYARMVNALGASGASGGQRLAAQLAGSQAMSNDLMNIMSAEENAYRQAIAEANKFNAAAETQAKMSALDANWKLENAQQEALKEAITAPKDKYDQMRRDAIALQYAQLGAPDISRNIQVGEVPFMQFAYDKYKKKKATRKGENKQ